MCTNSSYTINADSNKNPSFAARNWYDVHSLPWHKLFSVKSCYSAHRTQRYKIVAGEFESQWLEAWRESWIVTVYTAAGHKRKNRRQSCETGHCPQVYDQTSVIEVCSETRVEHSKPLYCYIAQKLMNRAARTGVLSALNCRRMTHPLVTPSHNVASCTSVALCCN